MSNYSDFVSSGGSAGAPVFSPSNITADHGYNGLTITDKVINGFEGPGSPSAYRNDRGNVGWVQASCDSTIFMPCRAIHVDPSGTGLNKILLVSGYYRNDTLFSGFTIALPVYMGQYAAYTQDPPSGSEHIVQIIGYYVGNNIIYFNPSETTITLVASGS